jgi:tRNA U34 5-carboxymethylaminomethyl modifying enzyme MnmG/GidA
MPQPILLDLLSIGHLSAQKEIQHITHCCRVLEDVGLMEMSDLTTLEKEGIEVEIKYAGFVKRQQAELNQMEGQHKRKLPADLDYQAIGTLAKEAREKLAKVHYYYYYK